MSKMIKSCGGLQPKYVIKKTSTGRSKKKSK